MYRDTHYKGRRDQGSLAVQLHICQLTMLRARLNVWLSAPSLVTPSAVYRLLSGLLLCRLQMSWGALACQPGAISGLLMMSQWTSLSPSFQNPVSRHHAEISSLASKLAVPVERPAELLAYKRAEPDFESQVIIRSFLICCAVPHFVDTQPDNPLVSACSVLACLVIATTERACRGGSLTQQYKLRAVHG